MRSGRGVCPEDRIPIQTGASRHRPGINAWSEQRKPSEGAIPGALSTNVAPGGLARLRAIKAHSPETGPPVLPRAEDRGSGEIRRLKPTLFKSL
jgi:hypothetical protein